MKQLVFVPVKWTSDWVTWTTWCVLCFVQIPSQTSTDQCVFWTCTSDTWTVVCGSCQSWGQSPWFVFFRKHVASTQQLRTLRAKKHDLDLNISPEPRN